MILTVLRLLSLVLTAVCHRHERAEPGSYLLMRLPASLNAVPAGDPPGVPRDL